MKKKFFLFVIPIMMVAFSVLMVGCQRSMSKPTATPAADSKEVNFPVGTKPAVDADIATQTAVAEESSSKDVGSEPTPLPTEPNPTTVIVINATATATVVPTATATSVPASPTATVVPPTPTVSPTVTLPSRPATYTLQWGEWPICIARRYNLNVDMLFKANNLTMASRPLVGTVLIIPQSGTWDSSKYTRYWHSHPGKYTVLHGDTINIIACYYGDIEPSTIAAANGLTPPYTLSVGQVLNIP